MSEANRDERSAAIYRAFLERRIQLTAAALDRARDRGEPIRSAADPALMVQWLAGVFIIRALTGEPMPAPEDADRLVHVHPAVRSWRRITAGCPVRWRDRPRLAR